MVIGIDAREVQNFPTGIGRYFVGLVEGLLKFGMSDSSSRSFWGAKRPQNLTRKTDSGQARMTDKIKFILFVNKGNPLIDKEYPGNWEVRIVRARPKSFLQQFLFPIEVWLTFRKIPPPRSPAGDHLGGVGRILLTNPFGFTVFCPVPQALIILDLIHKYVPQEASFKAKLYDAVLGKLAARRARVVFTCSENSKRDIVKFLGVSEGKIVVTPLGVPSSFRRPSLLATRGVAATRSGLSQDDRRVLGKYDIQKQYILYVGNIRPHKNVQKLLEAFAEVRIQNSEFRSLNLVIVGSDVGRMRPRVRILKQVQDDNVEILSLVSDKDLAILYRQAEMLVQPSLYEGFGMSVLEAMACGCPVVASKTSSIPEVGGDVPVYVDPEDPKDIARGIREVLGYNMAEREKVVEKGLKRAKKFRWEECARQTLEALGMSNVKTQMSKPHFKT